MKLKMLQILSCAVLVCLFFAAKAQSCQPCRTEKSLTFDESIGKADLIAVGTRNFYKTDEPQPATIEIQVGTVLRGAVKDNQIRVRSFSGMCPYGVVIEDAAKYLLILRGRDENGVYHPVATCSEKFLKIERAGANEFVTVNDKSGERKILLSAVVVEHVAPPEYHRAWEFLQRLKSAADPNGLGFVEADNKGWSVENVMQFISAKGLEVADVNLADKRAKLVAAEAVRRDLTTKRGRVATLLAHVGYLYSQPYPQNSTVSYKPAKNGVTLELTGGYRLTFVKENDSLQLAKLEYLQIEGD